MTVAAILTITISLFLCTFFWLIIANLNANANKVEEDVRVMAYLDFDLTQRDYRNIETQIKFISGVKNVEFVSKDQGLESLEGRFNDSNLLATLGGKNPLPDSFSITAAGADDVKPIYDAVKKIDGIYEATYGAGTVERLFALTDTLRQAGLAVMILLCVAAVVLIALSIRLTILARKKEIMVMKWCGATDAFVRWPFFLEGMMLGVLGALLALGLEMLLYSQAAAYISATVSFVQILPLSQVWGSATVFTLGAGLLLGAIGSVIPLARFLKV
ncbi:MAG: ABC transporter permease [Clostridia bacterium]|nr:ABC transporter permease [Clostridia bacterium]